MPAYVKQTGDLAFYDKVLPYADRGEETVLGRLRRATEFSLERTGAHGLPCRLEADWDDCLRMGEKGESVFVTFLLRLALTVYSEVCEGRHRPAEARWACDRLAELDEHTQPHCWDGEWFVRAFQHGGTVIGTQDGDEGRIFLNAQSWAVLSGAATPDQAERCMQSVNEHLATPYG